MIYKSLDSEAKVIGQAMLGFRAVIHQDIIDPLLVKHGFSDIQPDHWYPMQKWLDVLNEMLDETKSTVPKMLALIDIGRGVAKNIYIPEEMEAAIVNNKEKFAEFMLVHGPASYFRDHQGSVGEYFLEQIGDNAFRATINTPYPPDFWYGLIYGIARRLGDSSLTVEYEDMAMRHAKSNELIIIYVRPQ